MQCNLINSTVKSNFMFEENKPVIDFYESLLPQEKKFFKMQLALACEVSLLSVSAWLKGNARIKNPYRVMINHIAGKPLFSTIKLASLSNV